VLRPDRADRRRRYERIRRCAYDGALTEGATATAVAASLGCGVPTAVADLREGETVLDLGRARERTY